MAEYNKMIKLSDGDGFTTGPAPRAVLVNSSGSGFFNDHYGNGFTLERSNAATGSEIYPVQISKAISISGDVYVLF